MRSETPLGLEATPRLIQPRGSFWPLLLLLLAVLPLYQAGALGPLKAGLYELRFALSPRAPTGDVVLVDIDAKSISAVGTWPWPRSVHAGLVDALVGAGASQIGLDIDFSTRSTDKEDEALEDALRRAGGSVILATFSQRQSFEASDEQISFNKPIERFADNSWSATVNVFPDRDGLVRKFPYGDLVDGEPTPSMPAMLSNTQVQVGRHFMMDFSIRAPLIDRISAIDVLRGGVDQGRLSEKKVIIGASAVELRDFFRVPVFGLIPGPLIQALAVETIIQGRALQESGFLFALGGMLVILCIADFSFAKVRWSAALAIFLAVSLACEASGLFLHRFYPLLLDTSAWQANLAGLALLRTIREIDFRRVLLAISRQETQDTRTVLDRVVRDNFAGVIVAADDGTITSASRTASELLNPGLEADLVGRNIDEALPPALAKVIRQTITQFREGQWRPRAPGDFEYTRTQNDTSILEYVVTPSPLGGGAPTGKDLARERVAACLTFIDITERRNAESRVAYMARFDTLTGLPNQNQLTEKLIQAMQSQSMRNGGCTLIYFDLNRFKNVNDTLGRSFGDLLLREVSDRTRMLLQDTDFLARLDGDQFAIVLTRPEGIAEAQKLAAQLIAILSETYVLNGHRAIVGATVGIAQGHGVEDDVVSLTKNAETAHRRAKEAGGQICAVFDPALDLGLRARQVLEMEIRDALDREEFTVFYQPQIDLASNTLTGVEALVRWHHPQRGPVSPVEFIPVAEDTGLIVALGAWVLRRACQDAASWPRPIKVAVNLSPIQFKRGDLVQTVRDALKESGLPPVQLDLEITESLFINDSRDVTSIADVLRSMGVTFSLDDFGTGYSSLNYLRKFQVEKIKLDRSFISGLPHDPESIAIVRAICTMAQDLDIKTNAEGIETPEQMNALRLLGCREGQGYLFGKPQPAADIVRALSTSSVSAVEAA